MPRFRFLRGTTTSPSAGAGAPRTVSRAGMTRREMLHALAAVGVGTAAGAGAHGYFYERHHLDVTRLVATVSGLPDALSGLRVGFLTDLHRSRSVPHDLIANAVRLGDGRTRTMYVLLLAAAFVLAVVASVVDRPLAAIGLLAVALAVPPVRTVRGGATGRELIAVLGATGRLQLAYGALVTLGVVLSG